MRRFESDGDDQTRVVVSDAKRRWVRDPAVETGEICRKHQQLDPRSRSRRCEDTARAVKGGRAGVGGRISDQQRTRLQCIWPSTSRSQGGARPRADRQHSVWVCGPAGFDRRVRHVSPNRQKARKPTKCQNAQRGGRAGFQGEYAELSVIVPGLGLDLAPP